MPRPNTAVVTLIPPAQDQWRCAREGYQSECLPGRLATGWIFSGVAASFGWNKTIIVTQLTPGKGRKAFTHANSWDSCNNLERTGHIYVQRSYYGTDTDPEDHMCSPLSQQHHSYILHREKKNKKTTILTDSCLNQQLFEPEFAKKVTFECKAIIRKPD